MPDTDTVYQTIVERTMESVLKTAESSKVRRDVIEAIKRKWAAELVKSSGHEPKSSLNALDSEPVDRSKYLLGRVTQAQVMKTEAIAAEPVLSSDDEFADEFGDAEFVHATEVGRKLAEMPVRPTEPTPAVARAPKPVVKKVIADAEELPDSLADPEYDAILEPSDCDVRIFGQTEVCESVEGPRRSDSRWMVTVLNGFVQLQSTGEEYLFRTANQMMPHASQH